jgi:hypothetical protein
MEDAAVRSRPRRALGFLTMVEHSCVYAVQTSGVVAAWESRTGHHTQTVKAGTSGQFEGETTPLAEVEVKQEDCSDYPLSNADQ